MPASPNAYQVPSPATWPVADVSQLKDAIRRLTQLSVGDNLPRTVAVRAHVIRRAIDLGRADLLPNNWTSNGHVHKKISLDLGWLRDDAWDLGRAALLPEVSRRTRTYIDFGGSLATVSVVGESDDIPVGDPYETGEWRQDA